MQGCPMAHWIIGKLHEKLKLWTLCLTEVLCPIKRDMSYGSLYANNKVSNSIDEKLICLSSNFRKIQTGIASNRGDAVYNPKGSRTLIKRLMVFRLSVCPSVEKFPKQRGKLHFHASIGVLVEK